MAAARTAGARPATSALRIVAPTANAITTPSRPACSRRGTPPGLSATNDRTGGRCECDAHRGASHRQDERLGQQLADDAAAAGADGGAHRDLAGAHAAAGEQQVGDVAARDEEHERHRAEQDEQPLTVVADDFRVKGIRDPDPDLVVVGILLRHLLINRLQFRIRLRDRHAAREPPDSGQVVVVVAGELLRREGDRCPQFRGVGGDVEGGRHHADDGVRDAVQTNLPAEDPGIGAETSRPQPVAEHGHAGLTRGVFGLA